MTEIFIDIVEGSNNTITVTENDNLTETYKLILMKNRIRINLTNKKVKFVFVKSNSKNGDIFDEMNISNPAEGEVEFPITNKITKDNGLYSCGLAIYNNEGYLEHTGIFNLYVKENLFEKVSDELIEHNTYKKLTSLLDKASDINNKLITNTSEANKVNNAAINLKNALEDEVNKASQVNDTLTKTNSAAVDKNTTLNNSLEEVKKLLTAVDKYNLDNYMRKVDIPSDKDCNSFKEINVFCVFDTGAGDFKNTPEGTLPQGSCRVFLLINRGYSDGRFQQEFINVYPQDRVTRYVRNFNSDSNGNWGIWWKVYDEANKPTPNDIGTYTKQEIDNKDNSTLNNAKTYADENFLTKAPIRLDKKDLNTITDPGRYVCANCINAPTTYGRMDVLVWNDYKSAKWITQIFYSDVSNKVFTRCSNKVDATTWTSWAIMYSSMNKPTPADIGASPSNHNHDNVYLGRKGEINSSTDFNTITEAGMYKVQGISASTPNSPIKAIPNLYAFGILLVFKSNVESEDRVLQAYYPHQAGGSTRIPISRMKNNNDWTPWERVTNGLNASDVGARPSNWNPTWNDVQDKPSSFPPSGHNHDDLYFRKGNWNTNGGQDLLVHGKRALVGTPEGNLYLGYGGDFTALYFGNNYKVYHTNNKPTPADIGAAPSDHNHDDRYLKKEVGSTNESFRFRTKFLEFGVDDSKLGEIGVGPNDTYIHNTKSNKYLALKDDGRLLYNNKEVCNRGHFSGNIGLNGYQMFPNGLLVQWGYVDMGKDTTKLVNFPKSFKDNNYNLQVSVYGGPGRVPAVKTYYAKNNNFYIQCEAGFCVYWEAKGSV